MEEDATTGQVAESAAQVYERFFVPALFGQWPDAVLRIAGVTSGMRVLDVGCGTGVVARAALDHVGAGGAITGLDLNPGMLDVARGQASAVTWVQGAAEDMPFEDDAFDAVVSHFALMFFSDRDVALSEMSRVARPGAPVAVVTWAGLDMTPGYAAMVDLLQRLFGSGRADALRAPFVLGTPELLHDTVSPHLEDVSVQRREGRARFDSIDAWVHTDIRGWTLADSITDDEYDLLRTHAERELAEFVGADGTVDFPAPALLAVGRAR
ncbi:MAG: methyltransferase domain-containing protein [Nocardioides sp.]